MELYGIIYYIGPNALRYNFESIIGKQMGLFLILVILREDASGSLVRLGVHSRLTCPSFFLHRSELETLRIIKVGDFLYRNPRGFN